MSSFHLDEVDIAVSYERTRPSASAQFIILRALISVVKSTNIILTKSNLLRESLFIILNSMISK